MKDRWKQTVQVTFSTVAAERREDIGGAKAGARPKPVWTDVN